MIPVTYCYPWTADTEDERHAKLKNIADSGIRRVVLTSGLLDKMTSDPQLLFSFRQDLKEYGLTFMDGHAPWGTWKDPGMPLEEYHDQVILRHKMAIRFCRDLNVTSLAFHTGNTFNSIFGKFTLEDYYAMLIRSMEELLPDAEKFGVVLCLENQWTPLNQSAYLLKAVQHFDSPWLGLCYDSGHANLTERGQDFPGKTIVPAIWNDIGLPVVWEEDMVGKFQPWLVNCHLHDNNGITDEHNLPGAGTVDWAHVMAVLKNAPRLQCVQSEVNVAKSGISPAGLRETFRKLSPDLDA